jgi:hypothetical protein
VNTGGGGGGGAMNTGGGGGAATSGGNGGKGVVIIRQDRSDSELFATTTGSPIVNITATHYIYTFTDSGTIQWGA